MINEKEKNKPTSFSDGLESAQKAIGWFESIDMRKAAEVLKAFVEQAAKISFTPSTKSNSTISSTESSTASTAPTKNSESSSKEDIHAELIDKIFDLLDDFGWFDGTNSRLTELETQLGKLLRKFPDRTSFFEQWLAKFEFSFLSKVVRDINYRAFLVIKENISPHDIKVEISHPDSDGYNVFHLFWDGLRSYLDSGQEIEIVTVKNFLTEIKDLLKSSEQNITELLAAEVYGEKPTDIFKRVAYAGFYEEEQFLQLLAPEIGQ